MKGKKKNRIDLEDIRIDEVVEVIRYAEENIDQEENIDRDENISFYVKKIKNTKKDVFFSYISPVSSFHSFFHFIQHRHRSSCIISCIIRSPLHRQR